MKKKVLYLASACLLVALYSCQKDEFKEAYQQKEDTVKTARVVSLPQEENDITYDNSGNPTDATSSGTTSSLKLDDQDIIIIMVKEVSDGDDEADGGDDSREKE